jgi:hypothetical protein
MLKINDMGFFDKFHKPEGVSVTEKPQSDSNTPPASETAAESKENGVLSGESPQGLEEQSKDVQAGVLKMEASTTVWSKTHLILAYVMYVF